MSVPRHSGLLVLMSPISGLVSMGVLTDPTGWGAVGHPEWGVLRIGHANPEVSTSGLQTLVLLTAAYHNKSAGLTSEDVIDAGFQEWLDDFEMSVPQFADSDDALLADMLQFEPSKYDLVLVDEHATIDYLEATRDNDYQGTIGVFYPPATVFNDHPYAILNTRWVTPEEQEAAALFHDFLLDDEMQRLALRDYSFRPANETIELDTLDSPLGQFASYGLQTGTVQAIEVPPVDVLVELDNLWVRNDYP
jgi:Ca-activated chloride channel family protein